MTVFENRRTFLSSILLAGGSAAAFGKSFQQTPVAPAPGDALFEHVQLQIARLLRAAQARGGWLSAEDAATTGAFMRVCAIHARGLRLDEAARAALSRRTDEIGRDGVLNTPLDLEPLRNSLRRKGFVVPERLANQLADADLATRVAALEMIRQGYTTRVCDRLAEALEAAAPQMARSQSGVRRIEAPDQSWCDFLLGQWVTYLSLAWYVGSIQDPGLLEFLNALWAGFILYVALYTAQC